MLSLNNNTRCAVIVASGPSAKGFIPPDDITVISVNGSIDWLSRADYWFSLDLSPPNLARLDNPRHGVNYCLAQEPNMCEELINNYPFVKVMTRLSSQQEEPKIKYSPEWWFWRWSCVKKLSTNPTVIHSGNSSWGALGLAYHLGFEDVALVGVDATNENRVEGGRCNNLTHLPLLFASALPQINVVSCGKMLGIPQMKFREWYESIVCRK